MVAGQGLKARAGGVRTSIEGHVTATAVPLAADGDSRQLRLQTPRLQHQRQRRDRLSQALWIRAGFGENVSDIGGF